MYSIIKRDKKYLDKLIASVLANFALEIDDIKPANRGFYGETWRLFSGTKSYFLKYNFSNTKNDFAKSLYVNDYLTKCGLDFAPKIIKTKSHKLYESFEEGIYAVFEWIDGENLETDETKLFEYDMLARVYSLKKFEGEIKVENFEISVIDEFYKLLNRLKTSSDANKNFLYEEINKKADLINFRESQLRKYHELCKLNTDDFHLTHGDAGGNLMVNGNQNYIIDWDTAMIAPPERDAWFVCINKLWGRDLFNSTLKKHGINYELKYERLAFYAYFSYFYYFTEYLTAVFDIKHAGDELINDVISYMDCWIENQLSFADKIV